MKTIYQKLLFLMLLLPLGVFAQSTVEGTVLDKVSKQPIPGVNVVIQGSAAGSQTDFDGKFKIGPVKKGDKLNFSFVGYNSASITYNGEASLSVSLEEQANQLQEVMIQVGYGSAKKKDATGSVALITSKDFNKGAITSADQLLAGKAAGVRITNSGGGPDAAPNIRIRGGASLNASNNPLIIIDGVPISDFNPKGIDNPFSLINPNDIESFSILKDASATAIYGVRASNGVILITTKKGTSGEPQFNYTSSVSFSRINKKLDVMDGPEFMRFIQEYFPGTGISSDKTNYLGIDDPSTDAIDNPATKDVIEGRILSNTDWQDEVLRTAISTDHNFSVRGSMYKKIPFRMSLGYANIQGIVKTSELERFSYSFKMTPKFLNDDLKVDLNLKGTFTDKNAVDDGGAVGRAVEMDPTKPVYGPSFNNKFGGYYQATTVTGGRENILGTTNPLARLQQRQQPERVLRFLGNVEFDYKLPFLKGLRAVLNMGIDASDARHRQVFDSNAIEQYRLDPSTSATDPLTNYFFYSGETESEWQTITNTNMDAYLAYSKTMTGFVTKFDAQAGYSYQNFVRDGVYTGYRANATTGRKEEFTDPNNPNNRYYQPVNLQAFFARTNVDLLGKYMFTATLRADASSLFTPENRWGFFPAIGAAWKIKEESFLKDSKFVQDLKVRVGWGKTGQATIENQFFPSQLLFQPGNTTSQYLPGVTIYSAKSYNPDLTWEKTTTINLGLDFEVFKNSILSGSVDVYKRKTTDLLATVTFPAGGTVNGEFIKNIGSIDGEGIETSLSVKAITTDNFSLTIGGNLAYNYSEVTDLGERTTINAGGGIGQTGNNLAYHHVGDQPFSAYVYEQVYDANGQPVVGAFVDRNGDGQITPADQYYVALQPNWTYGFSLNTTYKNFDLTANFRGQLGGQVYNIKKKDYGALQSAIPQNGNGLNNVLDFYSGVADPVFNTFVGSERSDYLLEDATFLRCDNISLTYKFPKFVKKSTLKVSGSVNNPFIITSYSGQDPENFGGIDGNSYPRPTTYTFGVSLDF